MGDVVYDALLGLMDIESPFVWYRVKMVYRGISEEDSRVVPGLIKEINFSAVTGEPVSGDFKLEHKCAGNENWENMMLAGKSVSGIVYAFYPKGEKVLYNVEGKFEKAHEFLRRRVKEENEDYFVDSAEVPVLIDPNNSFKSVLFYLKDSSHGLCTFDSPHFNPADLVGREDLLDWLDVYSCHKDSCVVSK